MSPPPPSDAGSAGLWNIHERNNRRSLMLCGAGAVIGLLIAGFGLFTAQGTRTFVVPPEDAATVNGTPILMADFISQLQALDNVPLAQATPEQKRKVLDDMIREELYVQRGVELGLTTDDIDVRNALTTGTEATVAQDAMTARPLDAELHAWYNAHRDTYSSEGVLTAREFLLPASAAPGADKIVAALRNHADPASLNLKSSGRIDDGPEFYFAAQIHLGPQIFAIAKAMHDGDVSNPITAPDGVHILVMQHNQAPLPAVYEAVQDRILQDFLSAKVARIQAGTEGFLRKRADIKIAPELR